MFLPLSKGVPQGSTLGPVLLTISINNIISSLDNGNAHIYVDDIVLFCCAKTAIIILQQVFHKL